MQRNAVTKDALCFNMFVEICAYEFAHVVLVFAWTGYFALILKLMYVSLLYTQGCYAYTRI